MSHSKLAKFEHIWCGRKPVFEFFFLILQLNFTAVWQYKLVTKCTRTTSNSFLEVTKANLESHAFVYCKSQKYLTAGT